MGSGEYHGIAQFQEHSYNCALGGTIVESTVCMGGGGGKDMEVGNSVVC